MRYAQKLTQLQKYRFFKVWIRNQTFIVIMTAVRHMDVFLCAAPVSNSNEFVWFE